MDQFTSQITPLFTQHFKRDLSEFLTPLSEESPTGASLQDEDVYQKIEEARIEEDNSTPRGVWEVELRHADWETVFHTSLQTLLEQSKDVQLAAWLLEAQIMRLGFAGIASSVYLLEQLAAQYWESVHPQPIDDDMDHRINVFEWINTKLSVRLKQIPITARPDSERQFSWSDWEMAIRHSQLKNAHPEMEVPDQENDMESVVLSINQTPVDFYHQLYTDLELALIAVDRLAALLDRKLAADSPSMSALTQVLEEVAGVAYQQLDQRGLLLTAVDQEHSQASSEQTDNGSVNFQGSDTGPLRDRHDAYIALRSIADFLVTNEPHSPAPYLIYKAIDWGSMNTSQLYQELFVQQQGQLNIFDVLGIQPEAVDTTVSAQQL